ncbi:MAG: FAD-dependent oxidoreductase [Alphaproteobacteria bacterium]
MERVRVAIIGGGIIGCSVLYHLARAGWTDCLLLEKATLTSGSTWHAAANGNTFHGSPLIAWATKQTFDLWSEIEAESGQAVSAHTVGGVMVARTQARMDELRRLKGIGRRIGVDYRLLSPAELKELWPVLEVGTVLGALFDPNGGHVDPYGLTQAYAKAARKRGATIREKTAVLALAPTPSGGWRVETERGAIEADIIVNAAGFYAGEIAAMTGARLPMIAMGHHYLITEPIPEMGAISREPPTLRDVDAGVYARREGGGILFGIYESDCREFGADGMPKDFVQQLLPPDLDRLTPTLEHVFAALPAIAKHGIKSVVHGPFCFTPDVRPLLGWMPGQRNHFAAAGFLAGISMSGGFGRLIVEWITEGAPSRDLAFCDVARYGDWSNGTFARARGHDAYATRYKMLFPNEEVTAGRPVRTTPMHERYKAMGAFFGMAEGWERPMWFGEPGTAPIETPTFRRSEAFDAMARECRHVMAEAGYGDLITYAKYEVSGRDAARFLDRVLPGRLPRQDGQIALSPLVNAKGGLMGDVTVLRLASDRYMLVGSGAASRIHLREVLPHLDGLDARLTNDTEGWGGFMLAGPKAGQVAGRLLGNAALPRFFEGREMAIDGLTSFVLRLSYVGELAYEFHCRLEDQLRLHDALLRAGDAVGVALKPFGARAMNAMRIEKAIPRTGDELNIEFSPFEAGMGRFLDLDKPGDFIGREALLAFRASAPRYAMVPLSIEDGDVDPIGGEPLMSNGTLAGYVSSASFGFRVGQRVGIGFVNPRFAEAGQRFDLRILDEPVGATVLAGAPYDPQGRRSRA